jgi:hypothetical protein
MVRFFAGSSSSDIRLTILTTVICLAMHATVDFPQNTTVSSDETFLKTTASTSRNLEIFQECRKSNFADVRPLLCSGRPRKFFVTWARCFSWKCKILKFRLGMQELLKKYLAPEVVRLISCLCFRLSVI